MTDEQIDLLAQTIYAGFVSDRAERYREPWDSLTPRTKGDFRRAARAVERTLCGNLHWLGDGMGRAPSPPVIEREGSRDQSLLPPLSPDSGRVEEKGDHGAVERLKAFLSAMEPGIAARPSLAVAKAYPSHIDELSCWDRFGTDLRSILSDLASATARAERAALPITMQDVRLAVGEGKLTAADVLAGSNAELKRRAALQTQTTGRTEP